jgi:hypothetical protein
VATSSLAAAGAPIAQRIDSDVLLAVCVLFWVLGLALYCAVMWQLNRRARRRELGIEDLHGDHWVAMGSLAISTLAGARVLAAMTVLGWGVHQAAHVLVLAVWVAALCWLPALVAAECWRLRRPPLYTTGRWSTVFPLGMLAVASHALWLTAVVAAAHIVFDVFTPLAAAALVGTAAGFALTRASAPDRSHAL